MGALRAMIAGAGTFLLLLAASPVYAPAAPLLSPLVVDWSSYFSLDWQTAQARGCAVVQGTIRNTSNYGARRIPLLIESLDASRTIVNERVEWLGSDLMPGDQIYFESPRRLWERSGP